MVSMVRNYLGGGIHSELRYVAPDILNAALQYVKYAGHALDNLLQLTTRYGCVWVAVSNRVVAAGGEQLDYVGGIMRCAWNYGGLLTAR